MQFLFYVWILTAIKEMTSLVLVRYLKQFLLKLPPLAFSSTLPYTANSSYYCPPFLVSATNQPYSPSPTHRYM